MKGETGKSLRSVAREIILRDATTADLAAINAIYNYYVDKSTCTYATEHTSEDDRKAWFVNRASNRPVIVAEEQNQVIGWASLSTWNIRCGYNATVESSVYIHPDHHRKGLGRTLMVELIARAKALQLHTIIAGISSDQEPSISLHESLGFQKISHFREVGFKFGKWLDCVHFQLMV